MGNTQSRGQDEGTMISMYIIFNNFNIWFHDKSLKMLLAKDG